MSLYSGDAFYLQLRSKTILSEYDRATGEFLSLTPSPGVIPCEYRHKWYSPKIDFLSYISAAEYNGVSSTTFMQCV